jgi:hypothetical protein
MYRTYEESMGYTRANRPAAMAQEQFESQAIAIALPRPQLLSVIASPSLFIISISSLALISLVLILLGL